MRYMYFVLIFLFPLELLGGTLLGNTSKVAKKEDSGGSGQQKKTLHLYSLLHSSGTNSHLIMSGQQ